MPMKKGMVKPQNQWASAMTEAHEILAGPYA
jgi:hypothetical protein